MFEIENIVWYVSNRGRISIARGFLFLPLSLSLSLCLYFLSLPLVCVESLIYTTVKYNFHWQLGLVRIVYNVCALCILYILLTQAQRIYSPVALGQANKVMGYRDEGKSLTHSLSVSRTYIHCYNSVGIHLLEACTTSVTRSYQHLLPSVTEIHSTEK